MTTENIFSTVCQYDVLDVCLRPCRPAAGQQLSRHSDQQSATHSLMHRYLQILTIRTHPNYSPTTPELVTLTIRPKKNIIDVSGNIVKTYRIGKRVILPTVIFCFKHYRIVIASICPVQMMTFQNFEHKTSFLVCW